MINERLFPHSLDKHHILTKIERKDKSMEALTPRQLVVATRIHFKHQNKLNDKMRKSIQSKFSLFCKQVSQYSNILFVAIPLENEQEIKQILSIIEIPSELMIEYIIVSPWIGYTSALNSVIRWISIKYKDIVYLSFQSLEITQLSVRIINILMHELMDNDTLCAGVKLIENQKEPWNTLNIYSLKKLNPFGFQLVSDGLSQDVPAGIEEVVTYSLIQKINGQQQNKCKLIAFNNNKEWKWDNDDFQLVSQERARYHEHKLQSKFQRANSQLLKFKDLPKMKVIEINYELLK